MGPSANKLSLREICRNSLGDYYLAINPGYDYVSYQQERMVPVLEGVDAGDIERLMIFMPAGHSKTQIATKAFIPWFLGRNRGKNVILLCHTDPLAKDFGSDIRNTMTNSAVHLSVFPECRVDSANHASNFFRTGTGCAFYAFGMDGGISGRRADLIQIDDPIKSLEDALSETEQHRLYEYYKAVIKDRLRPGGRIILTMTRWSLRDLAARILEDEGSRWKVLVLKAQEHEPDGPYLWESHFGRPRYEEAKEDAYIWNAKWQQNPAPRSAQGFRQEWLRFYLPKGQKPQLLEDGTPYAIESDFAKLAKFNTYMFCDPALGKGAQHDRTCILVIAAGPERRLFLVDAVLDRLDPTERIDKFVELIRTWEPKQFLYEEYGLLADTHFIAQRFETEGIDLLPLSVGRKATSGISGGRLRKEDRIWRLVPDFREARLWLPKKMVRTLADGSQFDIIRYFIEREYLPYAGEGSVAHDDMLDCLSRIHEGEIFFEHEERDAEEDDDGYSHAHSGGSWESR